MFGLDDHIAGWASGSLLVLLGVAALLGLRHATDPDHIVAVSTLAASDRPGSATRLGAFWGLGHALTLVLFGVPVLLFKASLPDVAQRAAETAVGALIVFLAVRLLVHHRHRSHEGRHTVRGPSAAFGIGLVHGMGGSAGTAVLLLAVVPSTELALPALVLFAACTGISMTFVTRVLGEVLSRHASRVATVTPLLGMVSLAFGVWYASAPWGLSPYPL